MKKHFLIAGAMLLFQAISSYAHAQQAEKGKNAYRFSIALASNYNTEQGSGASASIGNTNLLSINARAMKDFRKRYANVSGEAWTDLDNGKSRAKFTVDGVNHTVYYAKNGNWTASLKNYTEDKLPFEVRDQVKRAYYDFTIAFVQEVETPESDGKPTYIIHIEDKHTYQFVRVCDGKMDIWKKLNKQ